MKTTQKKRQKGRTKKHEGAQRLNEANSEAGTSQTPRAPAGADGQNAAQTPYFPVASSCSASSFAMHSSTEAPARRSRTMRHTLPHCSTSMPALEAST